MTLAIDASGPIGAFGALCLTGSSATVTSGSFSPPANSLLVALIVTNGNATGLDEQSNRSRTPAPQCLSAGPRKSRRTANPTRTTERASTGSAPKSGPRHAAQSGRDHRNRHRWRRGHRTVHNQREGHGPDRHFNASRWVKGTNSNASGTPTVTVTDSTVESYVFAACGDWSTKAVGDYTTVDTPLTAAYDTVSGTDYTIHDFRTTSVLASGGTKAMSLDGPSSENYNIVALEILATVGIHPDRAAGR